jgi:hypothetical protein
MPFGQSVPIASPIAAIAGLLAGEVCRAIAEEMECGEVAQRIATGIGHALASAGAGYCVNAVLGADVTGAAVTTGQTALTATAHAFFTSGHPVGPGPLRF